MALLPVALAALAAHLAERRPAIMKAWREAIRRDPSLTSGDALPRAQLNDHIPSVLVAFERELSAPGAGQRTDVAIDMAAAHGMHRWQQGYDLREVVRELGCLNVCVVDELETYAAAHRQLDAGVMRDARRCWASACSMGIEESAAQYFRLQQAEAAGHLSDLEKALDAVRELERQRAELWREIAHDLRGNVGVVSNATTGLAMVAGPDARAERLLRMLQRNVSALHHLLDDVTELARLQAGHEERTLSRFDVGALLSELCEGLLPLAQERGLFLRWQGPPSFDVEGDAVKLRRLAQNLVLNAVKYTQRGGVTVSWGDSGADDRKRWLLSVEDTGPGFSAGPSAPIAGALEQATQLVPEAETGATFTASGVDRAPPKLAPAPDARPDAQRAGEGIGLSIVKRLSEMLDGSIELDSTHGRGTVFRVYLPRLYLA
ncbi:MAG: HAMP domain-containing sensor histidine kinase [Caldimonas sp.]